MRIAAAAATPPNAGFRLRLPVTNATDNIHNAAAGTSLMGWTSWYRKIGLDAATRADARPIRRLTRDATTNVAPTRSAPKSGTTRNAASTPPAATNGAIAIERPDGQIGTIAPGTVGDGR